MYIISESSRQRLRTLYPNFVSSIEQTKDALLLWKAIASTHSSFIQSGTTTLDNLNALSGVVDRVMLPIVESTADITCDGTLVHLHDLNSSLVTAKGSDSALEVFLLSLDNRCVVLVHSKLALLSGGNQVVSTTFIEDIYLYYLSRLLLSFLFGKYSKYLIEDYLYQDNLLI